MRKKLTKIIVSCLTACSLLLQPISMTEAAEVTKKGFTDDGLYMYSIHNGEATIKLLDSVFTEVKTEIQVETDEGYKTKEDITLTLPSTLTIPGEVDGFRVSMVDLSILDSSAILVNGKKYYQNKITSSIDTVVFDNVSGKYEERDKKFNITSNGNPIFSGASLLSSVRRVYFLPSCTCERINTYMFTPFNNVEEINLPESVRVLEEDAFYDCRKLETLSIPDSTELYEWGCLATCDSLKTIYFNYADRLIELGDERLLCNLSNITFAQRTNIAYADIEGLDAEIKVTEEQLSSGVKPSGFKLSYYGEDITDKTSYYYENNFAYGNAKVVFMGLNEYCGTYEANYAIVPKDGYVDITPPPTPEPTATPVPTREPVVFPTLRPTNTPAPTEEPITDTPEPTAVVPTNAATPTPIIIEKPQPTPVVIIDTKVITKDNTKKIKEPTKIKVVEDDGTKVVINIKKVKGVAGYQVAYRNKGEKEKKVNSKKLKITIKVKKRTDYIKIRNMYYDTDGKKKYGKWKIISKKRFFA